MKRFLVDLAWALAALVLAFVLWMVASPARAADITITGTNCKLDSERGMVCEYPIAAVDRVIRSNNAHWEERQRLERVLKERAEGAAPKCADVTVTEPSKAPKIPYIPREPVDGGRS